MQVLGNVYWRWDKADLFDIVNVTLPLEEVISATNTAGTSSDSGWALMHAKCHPEALHQIVSDPQTRSILRIATQKVEYIEAIGTFACGT
jgi:TetR/AcrR family acrAB operon transcriptional repressor